MKCLLGPLPSCKKQSKRNPEPPADAHSQALCINYAFETLGVFLGNHFPAGEEKLTSFRNKLEILLIPMEKYNFEVTEETKTNELS